MSETAPPPVKPPESEALVGCQHCRAGHRPERRAETGEMIHRWATKTGASTRYSIVLCVDRNRGVRRTGG